MTKGGPTINKCIYCGAHVASKTDPTVLLGREHVIPQALGGTITVLRATCKCCQDKINSTVEGVVINREFELIRHYLRLPSDSRPRSWPIEVCPKIGGWRTWNISVSDAPVSMKLPVYGAPATLIGGTANHNLTPIRWRRTKTFRLKTERLRRKLKAAHVRLPTVEFNVPLFARLLAKIGHAFTVHELGNSGELARYHPFLLDHILGNACDTPLAAYIGNPAEFDVLDAMGNSLVERVGEKEIHRLTLLGGFGSLQVYAQLFGAFDMPPYIIVTGALD